MTDYDKLVKALRCKRDDCEGCDLAFLDKDEGWMCQYAAKDDDAANAIEAMMKETAEAWDTAQHWAAKAQAQLPKRGKWIYKTVRGDNVPCCSICGMDNGTLYEFDHCPSCGAEMEVQG